jgi:hypothetical protein
MKPYSSSKPKEGRDKVAIEPERTQEPNVAGTCLTATNGRETRLETIVREAAERIGGAQTDVREKEEGGCTNKTKKEKGGDCQQ